MDNEPVNGKVRGKGRLEDQDAVPPHGLVKGKTRSDWAHHRDRVRATNRARYKAQVRLIQEKPERFDQLYAEEAAKEGVQPRGRQAVLSESELIAKIERLRKQLQKVQGRADG